MVFKQSHQHQWREHRSNTPLMFMTEGHISETKDQAPLGLTRGPAQIPLECAPRPVHHA